MIATRKYVEKRLNELILRVNLFEETQWNLDRRITDLSHATYALAEHFGVTMVHPRNPIKVVELEKDE